MAKTWREIENEKMNDYYNSQKSSTSSTKSSGSSTKSSATSSGSGGATEIRPGVYSSNDLPQKGEVGYYYTGSRSSGSGSSSGSSSDARKRAEEAQKAAQEAALEEAARKAQTAQVNQSYDDIVREAYADYRRNRAEFAQDTAGVSAGAADMLFSDNDRIYRDALLMAEQERRQAIADIEAKLEGAGNVGLVSLADKMKASQLALEQALATGVSISADTKEAHPSLKLPELQQDEGGTGGNTDMLSLIQGWRDGMDDDGFSRMIRMALERGQISMEDYESWQKSGG